MLLDPKAIMIQTPLRSNTEITIEYCQKKENPQWDTFISQIHGVNYEQTSVWAEACLKNNFCDEHFRIILYKKNTILAGTQVLIRSYGKFAKIGIISQGPCLSAEVTPDIIDLLIREIKQSVRNKKLLYLTIDVFNYLNHLPIFLLKAGFKKAIKILPPQPIIESTTITDLTKPQEEIFKKFDYPRKRNIKSGLALDFTIREGERKDIAIFHKLVKDTCKRRDTRPFFTNINYFYNIWDLFQPKGWMKLYIAEVENNPVCALMSYTFGDTYRYEFWGWNGEYAKEKITETFQWKNILKAKEMGFKHYDYVQLDPVSYKAILSKKEIPEKIRNRELFGATYFKLRWGGAIIDYPGFYTFYRNEWVKIVMFLISKLLILNKHYKNLKKQIKRS